MKCLNFAFYLDFPPRERLNIEQIFIKNVVQKTLSKVKKLNFLSSFLLIATNKRTLGLESLSYFSL